MVARHHITGGTRHRAQPTGGLSWRDRRLAIRTTRVQVWSSVRGAQVKTRSSTCAVASAAPLRSASSRPFQKPFSVGGTMLLLPLFVDLRLYLSVLFELGLLSFCFL